MGVPLYTAAIGVVPLASAIWCFRQRDIIGMMASLLMGAQSAHALSPPPA